MIPKQQRVMGEVKTPPNLCPIDFTERQDPILLQGNPQTRQGRYAKEIKLNPLKAGASAVVAVKVEGREETVAFNSQRE